jgi:serine/threonine protein kinase
LYERIRNRFTQIQKTAFEQKPLSKKELINIALFIETNISKTQDVAERFFSMKATKLARNIQYNPQLQEVFLLSKHSCSLIQKEGSFKRLSTALRLPLNDTTSVPILGAHLETKTEESIDHPHAINHELGIARNEAVICRHLKPIPLVSQILSACEYTEEVRIQKKKVRLPKMSFVFEFEGEQLLSFVSQPKSTLSFQDKLSIARDLTHALRLLHEQHLIHGDLKLQNVLCQKISDAFQVRLCDFGAAFTWKQGARFPGLFNVGYYGTVAATAPELFGKRYFDGDPAKVDAWGLGCMLYQLYFQKKLPWSDLLDKHDDENFDNAAMQFKDLYRLDHTTLQYRHMIVQAVEIPYALLAAKKTLSVEERFKAIIYRLMRLDPNDRIYADQAFQELHAHCLQKEAPLPISFDFQNHNYDFQIDQGELLIQETDRKMSVHDTVQALEQLFSKHSIRDASKPTMKNFIRGLHTRVEASICRKHPIFGKFLVLLSKLCPWGVLYKLQHTQNRLDKSSQEQSVPVIFKKRIEPFKENEVKTKSVEEVPQKTVARTRKQVFDDMQSGSFDRDTEASLIQTLIEDAEDGFALLQSALRNNLPDVMCEKIATTILATADESKKPLQILERIARRMDQIRSASFERDPMLGSELLKLSLFIEINMHKTEKTAQAVLLRRDTALPRRLFLDTKEGLIYIFARRKASKLQAEGSFKWIADAIIIPFQDVRAQAQLVAQQAVKMKSEETELQKNINNAKKEIAFAQRIKSAPAGLVTIRKAIVLPSGPSKKVYRNLMIVERGEACLDAIKRPLNIQEQVLIAKKIGAAIQYLHAHHLVHGDIKPENIILFFDANGTVIDAKLTDYGMSFHYDNLAEKDTSFAGVEMFCAGLYGTIKCSAPEMLLKQNFTGDLSQVEAWAFGLILYTMYFQKSPPWEEVIQTAWNKGELASKKKEILKQVQAHVATLPHGKPYEQIIYGLLQQDPRKKRLTINGALEKLERLFISNDCCADQIACDVENS